MNNGGGGRSSSRLRDLQVRMHVLNRRRPPPPAPPGRGASIPLLRRRHGGCGGEGQGQGEKEKKSPRDDHRFGGGGGGKNDKTMIRMKLLSNPYGFSSSDDADTDIFSSDAEDDLAGRGMCNSKRLAAGESAQTFSSSRSFFDSSEFYNNRRGRVRPSSAWSPLSTSAAGTLRRLSVSADSGTRAPYEVEDEEHALPVGVHVVSNPTRATVWIEPWHVHVGCGALA